MFWLEPYQTGQAPRRGSPRLFRVEWLERHVSRVRPWQVMLVWVPVTLWFAARSLRDPEVGPWGSACLFLAGLLAWTLLEYTLHRWVFHFAPAPSSELQRDLAYLMHGVHHDWPYDADRLVLPPLVAVMLALAIGLPMRALLGPHLFPGAFAGLVAGYVWYDLTHYAVHHMKQRTGLGKLQRRNHMLHHFALPDARYGVTTPLWDLCFGTYTAARHAPAAHREGEGSARA